MTRHATYYRPVDALIRDLARIVGSGHVLAEPELVAPYEVDWTGRFRGRARLVARPSNTSEVAALVAACRKAAVAIVAQGGNTGLVGGGVPRDGEVVVSLARLTNVASVDVAAAQVAAGAGTTLADLQARLHGSGLELAIDHAARSGATLGGMVATNAGGTRALRHGSMRTQLAGLEAVLADGSVLTHMSGLEKEGGGYDLVRLIAGSEGTLAIVTRVLVGLIPAPRHRVAALFALASCADAVALLARLRERLSSLEAAELFFADGLELVCRHARLPPPFSSTSAAYLLVECADVSDPTQSLAAAAADAPEVRDVAVADDSARRAALWAYRDGLTDAINASGTPHKLDVAIPVHAVPEFVRRVREQLEPRAIIFGHLGDGNLHVNLLGLDPDEERSDELVLRLAVDCGGSVAAEHGVGVAKRRWLGLSRSPAELAAMAAIKRALDPDGLLNPGVLLPPDARTT